MPTAATTCVLVLAICLATVGYVAAPAIICALAALYEFGLPYVGRR